MAAFVQSDHGGHDGVSSPTLGEEGIFLHDPLAVGVALDPSLVRQEPMAVAVETRGALTAGMAVADLRRGSHAAPTAHVCARGRRG